MLLGALSTLSHVNFFAVPRSGLDIEHLNGSDPLGPPLFDPAYLTTEYDLLVSVQGCDLAQRIHGNHRAPIDDLGDAFGIQGFIVIDQYIRNGIQDGAFVVDPDLRQRNQGSSGC